MKPVPGHVAQDHTMSLKKISEEVQRRLGQAEDHQRACLRELNEVGALLLQAKAKVGHGNFGAWINTEFRYGLRMAQICIQLNQGWQILTSSPGWEHLTSINEAVEIIRKSKSETHCAFENDGREASVLDQPPETNERVTGELTAETTSDGDQQRGSCIAADTPEYLRPVLQSSKSFVQVHKLAARTANEMRTLEDSPGYRAIEAHELKLRDRKLTKRVRSSVFSTLAAEVAALKPVAVCPDCKGNAPSEDAEWCNRCGGKGFLIQQEVE
jgi:hypothetical protein